MGAVTILVVHVVVPCTLYLIRYFAAQSTPLQFTVAPVPVIFETVMFEGVAHDNVETVVGTDTAEHPVPSVTVTE
ncbi:hypothetical protein LBMAG27_05660 [Bacteroidota bacterium]|nr:hypothetical protein LBMAG27_05660 [Bacteroidota bacterium]